MTPILAIVATLLGVVISALVTTYLGKRSTRGDTGTSDAKTVFEAMRSELVRRDTENAAMRAEAVALRTEMAAGREESVTQRIELATSRVEMVALREEAVTLRQNMASMEVALEECKRLLRENTRVAKRKVAQ